MASLKNKALVSLIIGILLASLHFILGYHVTIDTMTDELRAIYALAKQEEASAAIKEICKLDLEVVLEEHLQQHYGKDRAAELLARIKFQPDPDKICLAYEDLQRIQELDKQRRQRQLYSLEMIEGKIATLRQVEDKKLAQKQKQALLKFVAALENVPQAFVIPHANYMHTGLAGIFAFITTLCFFWAKQIYTKILLGMIAGAAFGYLFGAVPASFVAPLGIIFIRLIKMVVVPLVFASLSLGVLSLGDIKKLGRIGGKTIAYYLVTTSFAITIGLVLANLIRPGDYIADKEKAQYMKKFEQTVKQKTDVRKSVDKTKMIVEIVPTNPIHSMTHGKMLQIIFFALLFGMVLASLGNDKKEVIEKGLDGINEAMIKMVIWIMEIAPIGVFALMADTVAKAGISILKALAVYALVVLIGLVLHVFLVYGTAVRIFARISLWQFFRKVYSALLIAFSTSSSAATLPVSMRCAEEKLEVDQEVSSFVLPLGATINMDGTALYQGVAAVFIAQVFSMSLDISQQLTILLTATLASIGTAAVPGAGIVILAMVLESIGVPTVGIALIMGVDRILDMCRTTVNVTGDLSATLFVHRTETRRQQKKPDS